MREILFRGKGTDGGLWSEGSLVQLETVTTIYVWPDGEEFEVDTETVGQYTGLRDKNNKRIFEGDIVLAGDRKSYATVYFTRGGWHLKFANSSEMLPDNSFHCVVVGNIHDNPELLEAKENEK
jgi:hypothetical protein